MATNGIGTRISTAMTQHRLSIALSGLMLRLLIAFIISWLILLTFFATNVASH